MKKCAHCPFYYVNWTRTAANFFFTYLEMQLRDICNHYAKSLDSQNACYLTWNLIGGSRLEIKKNEENLSKIAYIVHSAAQQVVSRRGLDENSCDLYKNKKVVLFFIVDCAKFLCSCHRFHRSFLISLTSLKNSKN